MKRFVTNFKTRAMYVGLAFVMGVSTLSSALPFILSQNASAAAITVVTQANPAGWVAIDDNGAGGSQSYVLGPVGAGSTGLGSAQLNTTGPQGYLFAKSAYGGTKIADISALSYSSYVQTGNNTIAPTLQINIDKDVADADNSWQGRLVYEPYMNASVTDGTWQSWNANLASSKFWLTKADLFDNNCGQGSPCTLSELTNYFPNIGVSTSQPLVGFKAGNWNPTTFVGNIDNFTFNDDTYDFEPYVPPCDTSTTSFDTFTNGSVNNQNGWKSTGSFDQSIVTNTYGYSSLGCKTLRISNAVTSGSFGDQTFSYSTVNEAGDAQATSGGVSGGVRQNHFEAQFDIASTQAAHQPGLSMSISPDRGDGARMSYLRFEDQADGIQVFFDDVTTTTNPADWNETKIATLSRTMPHTVKFVIDFKNGPSNDIVKIYIDGEIKITGTTWENYYRFDDESNPTLANESRTVDSLIFRVAGTPAPTTSNKGFLLDNVDITTSTILPQPPTITDETVTNTSLWGDGYNILGISNHISTATGLPTVGGTIKVGANFADNVKLTNVIALLPGRGFFSDNEFTPFPTNNHTWQPVAQGKYTVTWDTKAGADWRAVPDGNYNFMFEARDSDYAQNGPQNSTTKTIQLTVDNTAPNVAFSGATPLENAVVRGNITIEGNFTDANGLMNTDIGVHAIAWYCHTDWPSVGSKSCVIDTTTLADGTHMLTMQGRDKAGNTFQIFRTIVVDNTIPVAPLNLSWTTSGSVSIPNNGATNNVSGVASWSASTSSDVHHYIYKYWNDIAGNQYKEASPWTNSPVLGTSLGGSFTEGEGVHYFSVAAVDNAGNISAFSTPFKITYDKTAPTVTINEINSTTDTTPEITGTVTGGDVSKVEVSFNNGTSWQLATLGAGTWSYQVTTPLTLGGVTVQARATDNANNTTNPVANESFTVSEEPTIDETSQNVTNQGNPALGDNTGDGIVADDVDVLGQQDTNAEQQVALENDSEADNSAVAGTTDEGDKTDDWTSPFGLAWYWWLLILAAVLGGLWWFFAARRSAKEE